MMTQGETRFVTIDEAAAILRDEMIANGWRGGANTISSWMLRGKISTKWRGRYRVVDLDEVRAYIRKFGLHAEVRDTKEE